MDVKIVNKSNNDLPQYATRWAAGMDVRAFISEPITLNSLERALVPTGLFVEIPRGNEIQVRPRSGLAANHGISVLNTPGTIDADYRGEIKVILVNLSKDQFTINPGDRIAQIILASVGKLEWKQVDELEPSDRGEGGFGSTGKS